VISSLRGVLVAREPVPVVDVGGVGFAVQVSARTAARLPGRGEIVAFHTYLHVREDHLALYGFAAEEERALFVQLLGVQGVGPRAALTLLSSAAHEELVRALQDGDEAYLVKLPGVGKKTAARLVLELQGKFGVRGAAPAAQTDEPLVEEAVLALASLGLTPRAAREAIDKVRARGLPPTTRVEDLVKAALQTGRPVA
jgi:Holliday junction DNA helicase RuvA